MKEFESAFVKNKKQLQDYPLLVHYDLKKPLWLACDASPYWIGAVISYEMESDPNITYDAHGEFTI